ncbi:MAG: protein-L-isoaspartate O-methyltransferase [Promethearchaeota archaeon]
MDRNERIKDGMKSRKKRLLDALILNDILKDKRLIKAFMEVPLEKFIPEKIYKIYNVRLYEDTPNLFYYDEKNPNSYRTISAPHMITIMLQGLALEANDDLLILGAKSGYIAALAHKLAPKGEIIILEANSEIAKITSENLKNLELEKNITIIVKNPLNGMPDLSPWQKILVTGAIEQAKIYPLLNQLDKEGGVLFAPIGPVQMQTYTQILRQENEFFGKKQLEVKFSPLITQIELDELELITDLDDFCAKEPLKTDYDDALSSGQRINIKYTSKILENITPEQSMKIETIDQKERDLVESYLQSILQIVKSLKNEEDIEIYFNQIDEIDNILDKLKSHKQDFGMKIKKIQNSMNQIRSCNIVRKELEKKDDKKAIDQKISILNQQISEINNLIEILQEEIERIKSVI